MRRKRPYNDLTCLICGFHAGDPSVMKKVCCFVKNTVCRWARILACLICRGLDAAKWRSLLRRLRRMLSTRSAR